MRISNVDGRLSVEADGRLFDVAKASGGAFGSDPQAIFDEWSSFRAWVAGTDFESLESLTQPRREQLGSPVPCPRQIFAVGLNYAAHADESGFEKPRSPVIFTKFLSSLSGPYGEVRMPAGSVDWEVELVVVLGAGGRNIPEAQAWEHVAGVSIGQDLSERELQHSGPAPQFSLAKSHAGFSPIGPRLVTLDELGDPLDLELGCSINGEQVQTGRTSELIFSVPELIAHLSSVVDLLPGDVIFTGTPSGVGAGRVPPRYLRDGDVLTSYISGIGEIEQRLVAAEQ